jgi:hypothetical protein
MEFQYENGWTHASESGYRELGVYARKARNQKGEK